MAKSPARMKWHKISHLVCVSNDFPPGFRIEFIRNSRVIRDDIVLLMDDGSNGAYPDAFCVWKFLECLMEEHVRRLNPDLAFDEVLLKDHRNRTVNQNLRLWAVRDMEGLANKSFDRKRGEREDQITELAYQIGAVVDDLIEECNEMGENGERVLARAMIECLFDFDKFDGDFLEYLLSKKAFVNVESEVDE